MRRRNRSTMLTDVATYAFLCTIALFTTAPILWAGAVSLAPEAGPARLTLANYAAVWTQSNGPALALNSLVVTGLTTAICIGAGIPAAYALSQIAHAGRRTVLGAVLLLRMVPAIMMIVPLWMMMRAAGLADTTLGLALACTALLLPLAVWMLKGFFDTLPPDVEDAARLDGCTRLGAMVRVMLPLARSGVAATALFVAVASWNEFLLALMLTSSHGSRTWPVGLHLMVGDFQLPWGMLAAGGIIGVAPATILFAVLYPALVRDPQGRGRDGSPRMMDAWLPALLGPLKGRSPGEG